MKALNCTIKGKVIEAKSDGPQKVLVLYDGYSAVRLLVPATAQLTYRDGQTIELPIRVSIYTKDNRPPSLMVWLDERRVTKP